MKIAIVGSSGFVGSALAIAVESNDKYQLIRVVRGNDIVRKLKSADVVIHSANPAGRFQAESDPGRDFRGTVEKTAKILMASQSKRFVLISSISCRTQMNIAYGRHRRACELMALMQNAVVVRLGPMYGGNRTCDTLHDIIADRPVYVAPESQYAYVDVEWAAQQILTYIEKKSQIFEIGAGNVISLAEIRDHFSSSSEFKGFDDTQIPQGYIDGPDARLVLDYAQKDLDRIERLK
jgi:nucleoside-diphosphate-sugar epimerase